MDALMVANSYLYLECKLFKIIDGFDLMKAYNLTPNIVTGIATNTLAGCELVENLCNVRALNLIDQKTTPEFMRLLGKSLGIRLN